MQRCNTFVNNRSIEKKADLHFGGHTGAFLAARGLFEPQRKNGKIWTDREAVQTRNAA